MQWGVPVVGMPYFFYPAEIKNISLILSEFTEIYVFLCK